MAKDTTNLKLVKPELEDDIENTIPALADNFDKIDIEINKQNVKLTQKADSKAIEFNVVHPPSPFAGLDNTGTTEVSSQLRSMLEYATGRTVVIPEGDYRLQSSITIPENTTIVLSPKARLYTVGGMKNIFKASGEVTATTPLTTSVAKGQRTITVQNVSLFNIGDVIKLKDNLKNMNNQPQRGEIHFVAAVNVASSTIELTEPTWSDYKTTYGGAVDKISTAKNINIRGGVFEGSGVDRGQYSALEFEYCQNVHLENITVRKWSERGVVFTSSIFWSVSHSYFEDIYDASGSGKETGYSIESAEGSQWGDVVHNMARNVAKLFDVSGSSSLWGHSRFINIGHNKIYGANRGAISTHASAEFIEIFGNHIYGSRNATAGTGHSIYTRNPNVKIYGNRIFDSAENGIDCRTEGFEGGVEIYDNYIVRSKTQGIRVAVTYPSDYPALKGKLTFVKINNNVILDTGSNGIFFTGDSGNFDIENTEIAGNEIIGFEGQTGINVFSSGVSFDGGIIANNVVKYTGTTPTGKTGIRLNPASVQQIRRYLIANNNVDGAEIGIRTEIQSRTVECFVNGNIARGKTAGISGFSGEQVGNNLSIVG